MKTFGGKAFECIPLHSNYETMSHHPTKRSLSLAILFFWTLILIPLPAVAQGQELVKNGGFESGMQGWKAVNAFAVTQNQLGYYDASSHPPHSGQYSAEVGTATQVGTLDQTVTIPAKSKATFSAWFRIEQGASLTIALKASDGSRIHQWSESGSQQWSQVTYDVSAQFAGQQITVEFTGQGNEQLTTVTYYCADAYGNVYLCSGLSYADYFAFVDDVSMIATIAEYDVNVIISGLPPGLSTNLIVDGAQTGSISGGQSQQFTFTIGETHTISIKDSIYQDNTTRYFCESPSASVNTDNQLTFSYKKQYYLSVDSPYGTVNGSNWYNEGSTATFSVDTATTPMTGILGTLGARYVFTGWTEGTSTGALQNSIVIDSPKSVSATWKEDYASVYLLAAIIIAAVAGAFIAFTRFAKRKARRGATISYDEGPGPVVIDVSAPITEVKESEQTQAEEKEPTTVAKESEKTQSKHRKTKEKDSSEPKSDK